MKSLAPDFLKNIMPLANRDMLLGRQSLHVKKRGVLMRAEALPFSRDQGEGSRRALVLGAYGHDKGRQTTALAALTGRRMRRLEYWTTGLPCMP